MHPLRALACACLALAALGAQAADNNKITIQNRIAQCQGCHGIEGWKTAFPEVYPVPKLGGQNRAYIVSALKAYKSGERDFATMRAIAMDLSDKDMEEVAAYYGAPGAAQAAAAPAALAPAPVPATPAPAAPTGGAKK
jgi:cytochrome c553